GGRTRLYVCARRLPLTGPPGIGTGTLQVTESPRSPPMVKTHYRVIYGDTDQMGVVYYGNYLRYFEAGRNEFLREKGARYRDVERELQIHLPVVEATVRYRHPARYDDLLRIETWIEEVRRASLRFAYRIVRDDDEIGRASCRERGE